MYFPQEIMEIIKNAFETNIYFELGNFENIKVYFDHSNYSIRNVFHHIQVS